MPEALRIKVLQAFDLYAEGGSMQAARDAVGISGRDFGRTLREYPELRQLMHDIQEDRADMNADEAYQISTDTSINPNTARVIADIRLKLASYWNRKRYGEKLQLEHEVGPNLVGALEAAKRRALPPPCNLGDAIEAEYRTIPPLIDHDATDKQSADAATGPANPPLPSRSDVFGD